MSYMGQKVLSTVDSLLHCTCSESLTYRNSIEYTDASDSKPYIIIPPNFGTCFFSLNLPQGFVQRGGGFPPPRILNSYVIITRFNGN